MKKIKLTQGYVAQVDDEDCDRISQYKWHAHVENRRDGTTRVYAVHTFAHIKGKPVTQRMHRFILNVTDPKIQIDHRDHNGLNNQRHNLRKAKHAQNQQNKRMQSNNTSGLKGVSWEKNRQEWRADIKVQGHKKFLGYFSDKQLAAKTYDTAALKYHGAFACTNAAMQEAA